jgi:peptidoglycan hydrolase CwlO-like protein
MATKDMAESEKNKAQDELSQREVELKSAQEQHDELNKKLQDLQSKVLYTYVAFESLKRTLMQFRYHLRLVTYYNNTELLFRPLSKNFSA